MPRNVDFSIVFWMVVSADLWGLFFHNPRVMVNGEMQLSWWLFFAIPSSLILVYLMAKKTSDGDF
jgi:hypothetical protein